jgi:hypothetical protein
MAASSLWSVLSHVKSLFAHCQNRDITSENAFIEKAVKQWMKTEPIKQAEVSLTALTVISAFISRYLPRSIIFSNAGTPSRRYRNLHQRCSILPPEHASPEGFISDSEVLGICELLSSQEI